MTDLLTVDRLMDSVTAQEISEAYVRHYGQDSWHSPQKIEEFRSVLRSMPSVSDPEARLKVRVYRQKSVGSDSRMIHVDGQDSAGRKWALDFTAWPEWKPMEVFAETEVSAAEMAAAVYQEMTWHGWPEQNEERRASLEDSIEELRRNLER